MAEKKLLCKYDPPGIEMAHLSRLYYGAVLTKLNGLEIERYFYTLVLIKEGEGTITQKDLSSKICTDKVFIVKILDYLSDKGMIKRHVNPKDRREHFITLTAKGEKLVPIIAKVFNEVNDALFKGLTKEEQAIYFKAKGIMKANLLAMPSEELKFNLKKVKKQQK